MNAPPIISAYDAIAPHYEEYSSKRSAYLDAIDGLVAERMAPTMRWLDVGSGDGRRLLKIRTLAKITDVVAVEPSAEMARICQERSGIPVHRIFAEELDSLAIGDFAVITALWNIFGHIPGMAARVKALRGIRGKLRDGGVVMLDVNNRHNALAYGRLRVGMRRILDRIAFREARGDAHYDWKIGDKVFSASGHLFIPAEMQRIFALAGFTVRERFSVNYLTGQISPSAFRGQLFYVLEKDTSHP